VAIRAGGEAGAGAHRFHPTILREYDIRGIVGETLLPADARAIGAAFGTMLVARGGLRVAVGYDGRLSSPDLVAAAIEGLRSTGLTVLAIGLGPTPMLYFAVHHLGTDGGLQVTGSHNPPSHNGFKMALAGGPVYGDAIAEIGRIAGRGAYARGEGGVEPVDVFEAYVARLARDFAGDRPLGVVWDAGNGAAGPAMAALARRLPGRHRCLFAEVDGRFPNHHPDPTVPGNLEALIREVRAGGYEVGIGFDGDGDRIGVVDGRGRIVWGDQLLMILAAEILAEYPGATIIADVKASQTLYDEIRRLGGRPLMWKTGHSLIKAKMAELGAPVSGEMSGHIFYKDRFYGHDDALYVAVRLLRILASGERTLADLKDAMPQSFSTPEVRFDCAEERKFAAIREIRAGLEAEGADVNGIDGVRVNTADGWWLLRASNTQAVLVARAESTTEAGFERLKEQVRHHLRRVGIEPPASF
jgi:phosphomannomutase